MTEKLSPCPLCGGEAIMLDGDGKPYFIIIVCRGIETETKGVYEGACGCKLSLETKSEQKALAVWNGRPKS